MKNKKINLKLGFFATIIGCLSLSLTSATSFRWNMSALDNLEAAYMKEKIIPIHFADNGNDFGGFFYFSNGLDDEVSGDSIYNIGILGGTAYECEKQIKGFYYNAERGDRLWPLDQETWSGVWNDAEITGGFYTTCYSGGYTGAIEECLSGATKDGSVVQTGFDECKDEVRANYKTDGNGYYGYVKHTYSGQEMGVVVGVNYTGYYNNTTGFISIDIGDNNFYPSFIRVSNKYPAGFVYDYNGGVGLVGCKVNMAQTGTKTIVERYNDNGHDLSEIFIESGGNLEYSGTDGVVSCSGGVWDPLLGIVIEGVVGMGETGNDNKFEIVGNQKNQKMQYFSSAGINNNTIINYARKKAELLCRGKWNNPDPDQSVLCYSGNTNIIAPINKTVIVKNGKKVTISPFSGGNTDDYYDIFIDSGNLIIDETGATQFVFNKNGFISSNSIESFSSDVTGAAGNYTGDDVSIGSFIRGNFIINGKIKSATEGSGLENKYFIHGKISTRDTFDTLLETFKWRCNNGRATNGTYCPLSLKESGWINPYEYAALVIIDQNYSSPFFNNY